MKRKSVYVIQADQWRHKIGISDDPKGRLASLQTGHYADLAVVFSVETDWAEEVEKFAHAALTRLRLRGEWFAVSVEVAVDTVRNAASEIAAKRGKPFHVGDIVLCFRGHADHDPEAHPQVGGHYTISEINEDLHMSLAEIPDAKNTWNPGAFKYVGRDSMPFLLRPPEYEQPPYGVDEDSLLDLAPRFEEAA